MGVKRDKLKVLFVCHNHPALYPGGAETYALQLYEEMRRSDEVEPVLLARAGVTPSTPGFRPHAGTPFGLFESDENQYWIYTNDSDFDWLNLTQRRKVLLTTYFRDFLLDLRPDVVHIHHTLFLGLDLLPEIRHSLPDAAIVHTLHEYRPICHRDGVMVRTRNDELCDHYSPRRCNECFPEIAPASFFMRKRLIESQLSLVDLFLAPSQFLIDRYVQWGLPPAKIRFHDHGRRTAADGESGSTQSRGRLGFFGQLSRYDGVDVLLKAMRILAEEEQLGGNGRLDAHLKLHGTRLEWQSADFQDEFADLLESTSSHVTLIDHYDDADLPELMAGIDWVVVPSLWWENSPLVVQDAFRTGRPVICSGIGALSEKVTHGVNGLHFRRGDAQSLAATLRLAIGSRDLWQTLSAGIPPVRSIEDDAHSLIDTYRELRESKAGRR